MERQDSKKVNWELETKDGAEIYVQWVAPEITEEDVLKGYESGTLIWETSPFDFDIDGKPGSKLLELDGKDITGTIWLD